jgi:excinuclease ABC subunit A
MAEAGFTRVRIDGHFHDIEDAPALDKKYKHDIEVVVDRLVVREGIETRLADCLEQALKLAEGLVYLDPADPPKNEEPLASSEVEKRPRGRVSTSLDTNGEGGKKEVLASNAPPRPHHLLRKFRLPRLRLHHRRDRAAALLLQRAPGRLPACDGLGEKLLFDPELVVPNENLSIKKGAVVPWAKSNPPSPYYMQVLGSSPAPMTSSSKPPGTSSRTSSAASSSTARTASPSH